MNCNARIIVGSARCGLALASLARESLNYFRELLLKSVLTANETSWPGSSVPLIRTA
jgi:hypothetical protein